MNVTPFLINDYDMFIFSESFRVYVFACRNRSLHREMIRNTRIFTYRNDSSTKSRNCFPDSMTYTIRSICTFLVIFLAHVLLGIVFVSICVYFGCYFFLSHNFYTDNSLGLFKKKTETTKE